MSTFSDKAIAVIGGGVSGIAAAHYLLEQGFRVDLYEASDRLGGRVSIDSLGADEICFGGKNIGYEYTEFRSFLKNYGAPKYEYFGINSARLVKGRPRIFNSRKKIKSLLTLMQTAEISDLIKMKKALKAIKLNRVTGDLCGPYFQDLSQKAGSKLSDHFSEKFVQSFLRPLTVRMNGAEPQHVSLQNLGTHLQMVQDEYEQLETSLGEIFKGFEQTEKLTVYLNHLVFGFTRDLAPSSKGYEFQTKTPLGVIQSRAYNDVILTLPASASASLLKADWPKLSETLEQVRYSPVGVIVADYKRKVFPPKMRAMTFGPNYPVSNIGAYGMNDLNRVRYTFSGDAAEDVLHESLDDTHLLNMAEAQAVPYLNLKDNPCRNFKFKFWTHGLCAYTKNEAEFQTQLDETLHDTRGLYVTGDYRKGASIENCFRASKSIVQSLVKTGPNSRHKTTPPQTEKRIGNAYV